MGSYGPSVGWGGHCACTIVIHDTVLPLHTHHHAHLPPHCSAVILRASCYIMTPARPLLARAWSLACHSAKDRVLEVPGSKVMSLNVLCQKIVRQYIRPPCTALQ